MQKKLKDPKLTQKDLISLKQDIALDAFHANGLVKDHRLAEIVWKINSVLYVNNTNQGN